MTDKGDVNESRDAVGDGGPAQASTKEGAGPSQAPRDGFVARIWSRVSVKVKGLLLLLAAGIPAGAAAYTYPQWQHQYFLSVYAFVPMLLFPASMLLLFAGIQYLRGRSEWVLGAAVALHGDHSPAAKVRDVSKWLSFSTVMLLAARIGTGWTFWWGATEKHPWNNWGWLKDWLLRVEVMYTPFPWYRDFLKGTVAPNFEPYAWFQFSVELMLGITLFVGIGTRFAGMLGGAWGAIIFFGNWNVPGEPFWILALLFLAPFAMAGSRAGRALGVDMLLQPKLAKNRFRVVRWVARWMM